MTKTEIRRMDIHKHNMSPSLSINRVFEWKEYNLFPFPDVPN